jgi:ribonuclease J
LSRIARGDHPDVVLNDGDTVIFSSRMIPGNEHSIHALQSLLIESGVEVITSFDDFVHVSGHPCRDELTQMYQWANPKIAIPVHGEMRHLREHVALAKSLQVPEALMTRNGGLMRLAPGPAEVIDEVPHGRLHLDGRIIVPDGSGAMRERKKVSYVGAIFVAIVMTDSGDLLEDARVAGFGLPNAKGQSGRTLIEALSDDVTNAIDNLLVRRRQSDEDVEEVARRAVRARLKMAWGKRPPIQVEIFRVED